jgi:hypothetical protein
MFFQSGHHQQEQTKKKQPLSSSWQQGTKITTITGAIMHWKKEGIAFHGRNEPLIRILLSPVLGVQDSFSCKVCIFKHAKTSAPLFSCTKPGTSQIHS